MKKILMMLCVVMMCFYLTACSNNTSSGNKQPSTNSTKSTTATTKSSGLTDSQIESAVVDKLIELIKKQYPAADAGSSTYSINKIEKESDGDYVVYGTVRLYDKYGKLTTGYYDGSGSYTRSFKITINGDTGRAYYGADIH